MIDSLLNEIRSNEKFSTAIIRGVSLQRADLMVNVDILTDKSYSDDDEKFVFNVVRKFVPEEFGCKVNIEKLSPDEGMVRGKILLFVAENYKPLAVTLSGEDISVQRSGGGFTYAVKVAPDFKEGEQFIQALNLFLCKNYCGKFEGKIIAADKSVEIVVEEERENVEYELPVRTFEVCSYTAIDSAIKPATAVYMSDLNFESQSVVICGTITDIRERTYTRGDKEKTYYNFTLNDGTASMRATYFTRMRTVDKIKKLKIGDSIVCTGKAEQYNGYLRYTANNIDFGAPPAGFVPEKRPSKPVPKYYTTVKPVPFTDVQQTDIFTVDVIPQCLKGKEFVVLDLETTGLNSVAASGNMDKIIELAAYKIKDGVIAESFTTFINPGVRLSEEIIKLTGITEEMLASAPTYEKVMPDFYKFCYGAILVGHNIEGFDFKFIDYYCAKLGYIIERKIIDTISLSQELLFLSNYKLNTVADKFGIEFNHHRAIDDAFVTAKIFIELIKLKKSLPQAL